MLMITAADEETMALSLQEQLLKAGLTDKKKVKQARKDKHKRVKAKQKNNIETVDENKLAAQAAVAAKKAKDRELNQQAQAQAEQKSIAAQIKQLIEINRQPKDNGDMVCNFTDGTIIKRMYVNKETHTHITKGKLAIVKLGQAYELVPMPIADKISERDANVVLYRADLLEEAKETSEQDDWYADYQIPDDLTW